MIIELGDVVRLKCDIPGTSLRVGDIGAVIAIFTEPNTAYEVEFTDTDGATIVQLPLLAEQFSIVDG